MAYVEARALPALRILTVLVAAGFWAPVAQAEIEDPRKVSDLVFLTAPGEVCPCDDDARLISLAHKSDGTTKPLPLPGALAIVVTSGNLLTFNSEGPDQNVDVKRYPSDCTAVVRIQRQRVPAESISAIGVAETDWSFLPNGVVITASTVLCVKATEVGTNVPLSVEATFQAFVTENE